MHTCLRSQLPAYFVQKTSCEPYREYTAVLAHANAQYFSVAVGNDAEGQLEDQAIGLQYAGIEGCSGQ